MAVFMINICKFNGCGITFPRLADLIEHIEDVHIDYDPAVVEQKEASQPACIPLSYVLKFFTDATRREFHSMPPLAPDTRHTPASDVRKRLFSAPKTPSVRSSTPTGSEMDEDDMMSPSEDSNDSWTTVEEYSSEYILRYGVKYLRMNGGAGGAGGASAAAARSPGLCAGPQDKPFACPVPGCLKRYKNVNGIKYHSKNGHKKDGKIKKAYKCQCGKSYKTAQGLKTHSMVLHAGSGATAAAAAAAVSVTSSAATAPVAVTSSGVPPTRTLAGLVVTAAPHRAPPIDTLDGNKLVRIYDSIKAREFPTFTIPKHSLNIVRAGALTKIDRSRVTVQTVQSITPSFAAESN